MWGKNKQLSVFFAGALLFGNYTDPSFLGSRFDLGGDFFAVAFPFVEQNYVDGVEDQGRSDQASAGPLAGEHRPSDRHIPEGIAGPFARTGTTTSGTRTRARSS